MVQQQHSYLVADRQSGMDWFYHGPALFCLIDCFSADRVQEKARPCEFVIGNYLRESLSIFSHFLFYLFLNLKSF